MTTLDDLTVPAPEPGPLDWDDWGAMTIAGLFPRDDLALSAYENEWAQHAPNIEGWPDVTPYTRYEALRALCCDGRIAAVVHELIGEPGGVHLNLTHWVSTRRNWHQDSYLNPPEVGDHYVAVWLALGDIQPDAGPFQYVPGSHRWPQVSRDKLAPYVDLDDPLWPRKSEPLLTPLFEQQIVDLGAPVLDYLPRRGDVLFWHSRLLHRGSEPRNKHLLRPALIAHYSGIEHRPDMPPAVQHDGGGWYFPL